MDWTKQVIDKYQAAIDVYTKGPPHRCLTVVVMGHGCWATREVHLMVNRYAKLPWFGMDSYPHCHGYCTQISIVSSFVFFPKRIPHDQDTVPHEVSSFSKMRYLKSSPSNISNLLQGRQDRSSLPAVVWVTPWLYHQLTSEIRHQTTINQGIKLMNSAVVNHSGSTNQSAK